MIDPFIRFEPGERNEERQGIERVRDTIVPFGSCSIVGQTLELKRFTQEVEPLLYSQPNDFPNSSNFPPLPSIPVSFPESLFEPSIRFHATCPLPYVAVLPLV